MLGHMGISGHILDWDKDVRRHAIERIALYKKLRPQIKTAQVHHLTDQTNQKEPNSVQALQYLNPKTDSSLVFVFHAGDPAMTTTLKLRRLNPYTTYCVTAPDNFGGTQLIKGCELMNDGLKVNFPNRGSSAIFQLEPTIP